MKQPALDSCFLTLRQAESVTRLNIGHPADVPLFVNMYIGSWNIDCAGAVCSRRIVRL